MIVHLLFVPLWIHQRGTSCSSDCVHNIQRLRSLLTSPPLPHAHLLPPGTPAVGSQRWLLPPCFLLRVPGNIAVIILKPNWQHLSSPGQSLTLNLAVSDLLCLLTLPLRVYTFLPGWTFGLVACKLLAYLVCCSLRGSWLWRCWVSGTIQQEHHWSTDISEQWP